MARSEAKSIVVQAKLDAAEIEKATLEWVNEKKKIAKTTTFKKMNGRKDDDDDDDNGDKNNSYLHNKNSNTIVYK